MKSTKADFVNYFPIELHLDIFGRLSPFQLTQCSQVSKDWNSICNSDVVWKFFYKKRWKVRRTNPNNWRLQYKEYYGVVCQNWLRGHFTQKHQSVKKPVTTFQFDEEKILFSQGNEIWMRDFPTYNKNTDPTQKWNVHGKFDVTALQFDERLVISGDTDGKIVSASLSSTDSTLSVMDPSIADEQAPESNGIAALQFDEQYICFARDKCVQLWELSTAEFFYSFAGHTATVRDIQFDERKIISGGSDGKVMIFDLRTGSVTNQLYSSLHPVNALQYADTEVTIGNAAGVVERIDLRTGAVISAFKHPNNVTQVVALSCNGEGLVVCHNNGRVYVWDGENGKILHSLDGHGDSITCLQSDNSNVVTTSTDASAGILIFDYNRTDNMFGANLLELDFGF
eukprot:TRINITY_DN7930_c0_g2_i1.p1 TRINITY_DN7930_c0_g2~~TRINITY_DN7930_c0_g2_i1.p1  ORF type:complete len:397 (-),score=29.44 TRINITY_DN7930_c0_g2_i1:192-1382(-)